MIPKRNPETTVEAIDDETLVLNQTTHQVHHLNASAAFIFQRCDGSTSIEEIVGALVAQFEVPVDAARQDVMVTLTQLEELALITLPRD